MKFSKIVVFFLFLTVLVFTAVVFYFAWHGKYVPEVLINRFFLAMLGEAGVIGAIKIAETIFEYRNMKAEMSQSYYEKVKPQDEPDYDWPYRTVPAKTTFYPLVQADENEGDGLDPGESPDDFEQIFPKT